MPVNSQPLVAAGIILRHKTSAGPRWLLLRAAKHGEWGFPKGHQDPGETVLETALRECAEECGIGLLAIDGDPIELRYRLPGGRSKTVVFYPALTECVTVSLSTEHNDSGWMNAAGIIDHLPHPTLRAMFSSYLKTLPN